MTGPVVCRRKGPLRGSFQVPGDKSVSHRALIFSALDPVSGSTGTIRTHLDEAGQVMANQPVTLQLRYLQTLTEIGVEKNTTIIFPVPLEFMKAFMNLSGIKPQLSGDGAKPEPSGTEEA